jgi:hypothetical protein
MAAAAATAASWWLGEPATGSDTFLQGKYALGQTVTSGGVKYKLVIGPEPSKQAVLSAVINDATVSQSPGWNLLKSAQGAAGNAAKTAENALPSWTDSLTTLLGDLTSKNTYIRVAKVVVGSVLIILGLAKITGADRAAAAAAKGALP